MKTLSIEKIFNALIIFMFLSLIFIPPSKMLLSPQVRWSQSEKRKLAELPQAPDSIHEIKNYFTQLDAYLRDHFGYRDFLITRYYREMSKRFGQTGLDSKVLQGKDGWYFFTAHNQLNDFLGKVPLPQDKLNAFITEHNQRYNWLASLGIEYLLMAPPGKHTIYPEYLPEEVQKMRGTTRFEQLINETADNPLPYLIDLHTPLREAKSTSQLYYKTDTHWNKHGAFVGFLSIVRALKERFPEEQFVTDFTFGEEYHVACSEVPKSCDLSRMAMRHNETSITFHTLKDFNQCARPRSFEHYHLSNYKRDRAKPSYAIGCQKRELTALVFRDSFFTEIQPFLSENFRHVVYLWKEYDQKNIEEIFDIYTPDVVIDAQVERKFFE